MKKQTSKSNSDVLEVEAINVILKILHGQKKPISPLDLQTKILQKGVKEPFGRVAVIKLADLGIITIRKDRKIVLTSIKKKTLTFKFEKHDGWWCVQCKEQPGCITQGKTLVSALMNAADAFRLLSKVDKQRWEQGIHG